MTKRPEKSRPAAADRLLGYARVSTEEQATDAQTDELQAAGCSTIYREHGSGAHWRAPNSPG